MEACAIVARRFFATQLWAEWKKAVSAHSTLLPWRELDDKSGCVYNLYIIYIALGLKKNNNPLEDAGIFKSIYTWYLEPQRPLFLKVNPPPKKKNKA